MARDKVNEDMVDNHYTWPHWARSKTETPIKLGERKEIAIDHGSEMNLMSIELYKKGRLFINTNHGWKIRVATKATGACPRVPITISDIEIDQHFLFQDSGSHPINLGQPYIILSGMEKVAPVYNVNSRASMELSTSMDSFLNVNKCQHLYKV